MVSECIDRQRCECRLGPISPKTLAARLRDIERARLVARTVHAEITPRVEYRLRTAGREFWRSATPLVARAGRRDHAVRE